jgi:putative transposase
MSIDRTGISIRWLCEYFEKSRPAYYQIRGRKTDAMVNEELIVHYVKGYREEQKQIGGRKLHHLLIGQLRTSGIKCGRDKLFGIMRRSGLLLRRKKRWYSGTQSVPISRRFPNLLTRMLIDRPEQVWVSDMTAVPVNDGLGYLALITDAYSKQIMGYNMRRTKDRSCSLAALRMALASRWYPDEELIHHSDGGGEYFNHDYLNLLVKAHCKLSCTAPSSPEENPIAERVNGILKEEFLLVEQSRPFKEIQRVLPRVIRIYNQIRPHASCDYMTPQQSHGCSGLLRKRWKNYRKKTNAGNTRLVHNKPQIEKIIDQLMSKKTELKPVNIF